VLTHQLFNEDDGRPAAAYDPNIGKALSDVDISKPVPEMWEYFDALASVPMMVLRGEHSDILSAATVQEMQKRHPGLVPVLIRNEGHAPLLLDKFSQRLVADFLSEADATWRKPAQLPPPIHKEVFEV
jgi:pimeloyl-ACP methyl ester carboxylesterase